MNYIGYMNQLWRSALVEPMPASEIALYTFIVNECNVRFWRMPIQCSTVRICESLRISKQTLTVAREHLRKRGLIHFTPGKSRHLPSEYMLLELTDDLTLRMTDDLTHNKENKNKYYNISSSKENFNANETNQRNRRAVEAVPAAAEKYEGAF